LSYIAFDLDALNVAANVGCAAGVSEDLVIAGLARMWAYCFRCPTDRVAATHLRGFFGGKDCSEALVAFGFLEHGESDFRVRGAERYLRVRDARRKGGLAASGNLRQGSKPSPAELRSAPADSRLDPGSLPALGPADSRPLHRAPNTDDRTPNGKATDMSGKPDQPVLSLVSPKAPTEPPHVKLEQALDDATGLQVWEHWRQKHPAARLDKKRKAAIERALADYPVADLQLAIDGCRMSPFHVERKDDRLELILRDAEHIERFRAIALEARGIRHA